MASEVVNAWRELDPIVRVQRYLAARGSWNEGIASNFQSEISSVIDRALAAASAVPPPKTEDLFMHTYAELTERQLRQLRAHTSSTT
jgi:TPP-dependent pyruvate/acetoin dehydrogenase alpha subunit